MHFIKVKDRSNNTIFVNIDKASSFVVPSENQTTINYGQYDEHRATAIPIKLFIGYIEQTTQSKIMQVGIESGSAESNKSEKQ